MRMCCHYNLMCIVDIRTWRHRKALVLGGGAHGRHAGFFLQLHRMAISVWRWLEKKGCRCRLVPET